MFSPTTFRDLLEAERTARGLTEFKHTNRRHDGRYIPDGADGWARGQQLKQAHDAAVHETKRQVPRKATTRKSASFVTRAHQKQY